jgi:hypothetical protein
MKNSAHNANSTELHTWFKTAVLNAQHRDAAEGPPCSIHPDFFDNPTVNAIKHLSFATIAHIKSAKDLTDGSLSVYNYIRMNETHASKTVPTIPADGFSAGALYDLLTNVYFLLHLLFVDVRYFDIVGQGHSPFSRLSTFAGHILLLATPYASRSFQQIWDKKPTAERLTYTCAFFHSLDALFSIYLQWEYETFSADKTFIPAATTDSPTTLHFLLPYVRAKTPTELLAKRLEDWRKEIEWTTITRIKQAPPDKGVFLKETPACVLPSSVPRVSFHTPPSYYDKRPSEHPQSRPSRLPPVVSDPPRPPLREQPSNPATGESSRAVKCLFRPAPGQSFQPIAQILRKLNEGRTDKLRVPSFPNHANVNVQPCFAHCSEGSTGCPKGERDCRFAHLDLCQPVNIRRHVPSAFFQDVMTFLRVPEIARLVTATDDLENFMRTV